MAKHTFLSTSIFNVDDMFDQRVHYMIAAQLSTAFQIFHYQIRCVVRAKEK